MGSKCGVLGILEALGVSGMLGLVEAGIQVLKVVSVMLIMKLKGQVF